MSVSRIAHRSVVTAAPEESVIEVTRRLDRNNVGTAVVVDEQALPVGIVTDRDIAIRCLARDHDPNDHISVIMSRTVVGVGESASIETALGKMADAGVRRLVVTGQGGRVAGIVSLDDIVAFLAGEAAKVGRLLDEEAPRIAHGPSGS